MTDTPPKTSALPMLGLQTMNAAGALSYGDQFGEAISQIVAWIMAVQCNCAPPPEVIKAVHYICVALVIGVAIVIQHKLLKNLN